MVTTLDSSHLIIEAYNVVHETITQKHLNKSKHTNIIQSQYLSKSYNKCNNLHKLVLMLAITPFLITFKTTAILDTNISLINLPDNNVTLKYNV